MSTDPCTFKLKYASTLPQVHVIRGEDGESVRLLGQALCRDFLREGKLLATICQGVPYFTIAGWLELTREDVSLVFDGYARLQPHSKVCAYLREKMKEHKEK